MDRGCDADTQNRVRGYRGLILDDASWVVMVVSGGLNLRSRSQACEGARRVAGMEGEVVMLKLTPQGEEIVEKLAQRHGVSTEAVMTLLQALVNGNGASAQFSHPELGGTGQWMRGGMTMVGDMFNDALKAKVNSLCSELSGLLGEASFADVSRAGASSGFQSQYQGWRGQQRSGSGDLG